MPTLSNIKFVYFRSLRYALSYSVLVFGQGIDFLFKSVWSYCVQNCAVEASDDGWELVRAMRARQVPWGLMMDDNGPNCKKERVLWLFI